MTRPIRRPGRTEPSQGRRTNRRDHPNPPPAEPRPPAPGAELCRYRAPFGPVLMSPKDRLDHPSQVGSSPKARASLARPEQTALAGGTSVKHDYAAGRADSQSAAERCG
jgi:hypothetical protein